MHLPSTVGAEENDGGGAMLGALLNVGGGGIGGVGIRERALGNRDTAAVL